jgi:hypothetical protein
LKIASLELKTWMALLRSTLGDQAAMTPFSVEKIKRLGWFDTGKSVGDPLKTIPVGLPHECLRQGPA